jgi:5'-phosphate synthase pdxT subunit
MRVGVLAIQGDVREHCAKLQQLGVDPVELRRSDQLEAVSGLIIPGGESTTIGMLMQEYGLIEAISNRVRGEGLPIWGTCAGLILLAKEVVGRSPARLGLVDLTADRNAWGRQVASFEVMIDIPVLGGEPFPAVFIRAPRIRRLGESVVPLASHDGQVVMAESGPFLVTAFHPELTPDLRVHQYFLTKIENFWTVRS